MYSVLVYFASVSIGFKFAFFLLSFGLLLGGLIYGPNKTSNKKIVISLVLTGILCGMICAAIPSEKDVYKIAATIGQDKTVLTPDGEIK